MYFQCVSVALVIRRAKFRFANSLWAGANAPAHKLSANLYDIYHCCVQWKTPDDGQRNCPKHVQFHSKNKFEKFVHLVGFIIRNLSWCTVTWKGGGGEPKNAVPGYLGCITVSLHQCDAWPKNIKSVKIDTRHTDQISTDMLQNPYQ